MAYYIDSEGNYPRHMGDIELLIAGWQEGDELPEGWLIVAEGIIPEYGVNETILETQPEVIDGILTRQFTVIEAEPVIVDVPTTPRMPELLNVSDETTSAVN